jgi:addiction module HigA family antidote
MPTSSAVTVTSPAARGLQDELLERKAHLTFAEEYLKPFGLSANALAQAIGVPGNCISDIVCARRDISADMAIRLGRFSTSIRDFG